MKPLEQLIVERLQDLAPESIHIEDESAAHHGHAGAQHGAAHLKLELVCAAFEGQNRVARHRMVYERLNDQMPHRIHALAILAIAPSEL